MSERFKSLPDPEDHKAATDMDWEGGMFYPTDTHPFNNLPEYRAYQLPAPDSTRSGGVHPNGHHPLEH